LIWRSRAVSVTASDRLLIWLPVLHLWPHEAVNLLSKVETIVFATSDRQSCR
jgi:hypothetical protein